MTETTRQKILDIAAELFAKNGYDSTSIRDISSEANVNLASINYHFKNKQNLYLNVLDNNMDTMRFSLEEIAKDSTNFREYCHLIFEHFRKNSNLFLNCFRLFISNNLPLEKDNLPGFCNAKDFNPPAFQSMLELLKNELPPTIPTKGIEWAARHIFNSIAHTNLLLSSTIVQLMEDEVDYLAPDEKKRSLDLLIDSVINYLKENPDKFE